MTPSDNQALGDELLRRYLLGALPEADMERLNELSVTDDELAGRLDAVENDLVDAYVRGELPQEDLGSFKGFYLSSPKRREKVGLAEGFLALERRAAAARAAAGVVSAVPASQSKAGASEGVPGKSPRGMLGARRPA